MVSFKGFGYICIEKLFIFYRQSKKKHNTVKVVEATQRGSENKTGKRGSEISTVKLVDNDDLDEIPSQATLLKSSPKTMNLVSSGKILRMMIGVEPVTKELLKICLEKLYGVVRQTLEVTSVPVLIQTMAIKAAKSNHVLLAKNANLNNLRKQDITVVKQVKVVNH